ncbi:MAG: hypothetical protein FWF76_01565 [Oscillospiraceae bacterium]|nr:hypothetical protein [Oscillospiraceae bacterium]
MKGTIFMENLSLFLKDNKVKKENAFFPATSSLLAPDGSPLLWEVRAISTSEDEAVREECMIYDATHSRFRLDASRYMAKIAALAVVSPNLYNANLQNSYDVSTPEDLIRELIDNPHEYQAFVRFVLQFGENSASINEKVESAKN